MQVVVVDYLLHPREALLLLEVQMEQYHLLFPLLLLVVVAVVIMVMVVRFNILDLLLLVVQVVDMGLLLLIDLLPTIVE